MSEDLGGLRKEPLFGRKERLYQAPDVDDKPVEKENPIKVKKVKEKSPAPAAGPVTEPEGSGNSTGKAVEWVSSALELLGVASLTTGGFLVAPWLGFMILGVLLLVLGVATGYGV